MSKSPTVVFSPSSSVSINLLQSLLFVFGTFLLTSNMGIDNQVNLNVFQWNARSLNSNHDQLIQHLNDSSVKYDILALQSIGGLSYELPIVPGFHYPPYFSIFESKIRTATYVRTGIQSSNTYVQDLKNGHAISC